MCACVKEMFTHTFRSLFRYESDSLGLHGQAHTHTHVAAMYKRCSHLEIIAQEKVHLELGAVLLAEHLHDIELAHIEPQRRRIHQN